MLVKEYFEELKNSGHGTDLIVLCVYNTHSMMVNVALCTADKHEVVYEDVDVICHKPFKSGKGEVVAVIEKYDYDTTENRPAEMKEFIYDLIEKYTTAHAEAL